MPGRHKILSKTPPRKQARSALTAIRALSIGDSLPTEFRLFTKGWNDTENGQYLFDADAATSVMAAYKAWGVDLAIDLEHQMLETDIAPDPTAKDARGWCKLELRDDGSLWAVNVSWTADGAARLSEKRQRYISPAFSVDPDTSRVTAIVNVAITAIPATHDTPALVAARRATDARLSTGLAFGDIQTALGAALGALYPSDDPCSMGGPWVQDVFDATFVFQYEGELFEAPYTFDGSTAALGAPVKVVRSYTPAPPAAPAPVTPPASAPVANKKSKPSAVRRLAATPGENKMTIDEFAKVCKALGIDGSMTLEAAMAKIQGGSTEEEESPPSSKDGGPPDSSATPPKPEAAGAAPAAADDTAPDSKKDKDKPEEVAAAASRLMRLTGAKSFVAAIDVVDTFRTSHLELETERQKLAAERDTLEAAERRKGCVDLVTLGGRAPSTVWADDTAKAPKKYLAAMSITDFRDYVADAVKSKGVKISSVKAPTTPAAEEGSKSFVVNGRTIEVTARELAICAEQKCEPETFAALKARRNPTA